MKTPNFKVEMLAKGKARIELYDLLGPAELGMIDVATVSRELKKAGDVSEIELRINSPGGSAYEGLAIHNLLKDHGAKVSVVVDGVAASAATLPMMAGDTIRMPRNAVMMIHEPMSFAGGNRHKLTKLIEQLDAVMEASVRTYAERTKQSPEQIKEWMSAETWLTGDQAVSYGFADATDDELSIVMAADVPRIATQFFEKAPTEFHSLYALAMRAEKEPPMSEKPAATEVLTANAEVFELREAVTQLQPVLTQADVDKSIQSSLAAERTRTSAIMSVCQRAGKPEMAAEFIASGISLAEVNAKMVDVLCQSRPPVGDAGGGGEQAPKDPDAESKALYAADRMIYQRMGISEEDFITSQRIAAGTEMLIKR